MLTNFAFLRDSQMRTKLKINMKRTIGEQYAYLLVMNAIKTRNKADLTICDEGAVEPRGFGLKSC